MAWTKGIISEANIDYYKSKVEKLNVGPCSTRLLLLLSKQDAVWSMLLTMPKDGGFSELVKTGNATSNFGKKMYKPIRYSCHLKKLATLMSASSS
jgi:hypothetical protein